MRKFMFFISYRSEILHDELVRYLTELTRHLEYLGSADQLYLFDTTELLSPLRPYLSGDIWFAPTASKHDACERLRFIASHNIRNHCSDADNGSQIATNEPRDQYSVILEDALLSRTALDCSLVRSNRDLHIFKEAVARISKSGRILKYSSKVHDTCLFLAKWNERDGNALIRIDLCSPQIMHENKAQAALTNLCDDHRFASVDENGKTVASICTYLLNDKSIDNPPGEAPESAYSLVAARDLYFGVTTRSKQSIGLLDNLCRTTPNKQERDFAQEEHRTVVSENGFSYRRARNLFFGNKAQPIH
jgi:hypothetical protein